MIDRPLLLTVVATALHITRLLRFGGHADVSHSVSDAERIVRKTFDSVPPKRKAHAKSTLRRRQEGGSNG